MRALKLAAFLMTAAACGSSETQLSTPAGGNPCSPDQPDFKPPIIGTWLRDSPSGRELWTFSEDCKLLEKRWTYVAHGAAWPLPDKETLYRFEKGRLLVLDGVDNQWAHKVTTTAYPFYVNATSLALRAFTPQGEHSGIVGTWSATMDTTTTDLDTGKTTHATRADTFEFTGSMTYTLHRRTLVDGVEQASDEAGTYGFSSYQPRPNQYVIKPNNGNYLMPTLQVLDDQALSRGVNDTGFAYEDFTRRP